LDDFVENEYARLQAVAEAMPPQRSEGWQCLDEVFRSLVVD